MKKPDADRLLDKTNKDPNGNLFYHPCILNNTIIGAVLGGVILGAVVWLMAKGLISVEGLGQISASGIATAAFLGFITGSAIGGLFGSVYGIFAMLKKKG